MAAKGARPIKVGLVLPTVDGTIPDGMPRWSDLKNLAQRAEAVSFDSLWVPDHLLFQDARAEGEIRFIYKPPNYYSMAAASARLRRSIWIGTHRGCSDWGHGFL